MIGQAQNGLGHGTRVRMCVALVSLSVATLTLWAPSIQAKGPEEAKPWTSHIGDVISQSVGSPSSGRLVNAVPLPEEGPGWRRRDGERFYGTHETIALLQWVSERLQGAFPGSVPLLIGDISEQRGGRAPPHRSHRSGRDVDIAFFEKGNVERSHFRGDMAAHEIDVDKSWFTIEGLLSTGRVQYIFVNRRLIPKFVRRARRYGWSRESIQKIFLRPEDTRRVGPIRHASGHTYHFHVRFHCPGNDEKCRD